MIVTPEDGSFVPRLDEVEEAFSSYTKALVVNSPNNPSGAVYPPELIEGLVELCEERGVHLIMDDIYHRLVFDGVRPAVRVRVHRSRRRRVDADRRQRRLEAVRDDGLPRRLDDRARAISSR